MTNRDPKKMDRAAVLAKVLEVNPSLRLGDKSNEEMTEYLLSTVRASRASPRFSDDKFLTVFRGMLAELESSSSGERSRLCQRRRELEEELQMLHQRARDCLVEFFVATHPGPLSKAAKSVLAGHDSFLRKIGTSLGALNRMIVEGSGRVDACKPIQGVK